MSSQFSCNVPMKMIWLYCHYCSHNTKQLKSAARKQGCICNPISYPRLINDHYYWETAKFISVMYSLCQLCVVGGKPSPFWFESPFGKQMFFSSGLWKNVLSFCSFFSLVNSGVGACPQWDILEIWSSPDTHTYVGGVTEIAKVRGTEFRTNSMFSFTWWYLYTSILSTYSYFLYKHHQKIIIWWPHRHMHDFILQFVVRIWRHWRFCVQPQ